MAAFANSAIVGIVVDAAIVLIILILLLVGSKRGLLKMLFGLVASIGVLFGAVAATSPVTNLITANTTWDDQLATALETKISGFLPEPNVVIKYYDDDNDPSTPDVLGYGADEEDMHPYSEIFEDNAIYQSAGLATLIQPAIEKALETMADGVYLIKAITYFIATIIIDAAVFTVLAILMRIVAALIFKLLKKLVASLYVFHFVDKLFGLIFGAALGAFIVLVILTIIQLMQGLSFMEPVNLVLENSYISTFVFQHNLLYAYIHNTLASGFLSSITAGLGRNS